MEARHIFILLRTQAEEDDTEMQRGATTEP